MRHPVICSAFNALLGLGRDSVEARLGIPARLDLDEGDDVLAARDQVNLSEGRSDAPPEDAITFEDESKRRQRFA